MRLHSPQEKYEFLKQCYEHITRIAASLGNFIQSPELRVSKECLVYDPTLPKSLTLQVPNWYKDNGIIKLEVLIAMYNRVTPQCDNLQVIDLKLLFKEIKQQEKASLKKFNENEYGKIDIDLIMASHRTEATNPFTKFLQSVFEPPSKAFLNRFRFFENEKNWYETDDDQDFVSTSDRKLSMMDVNT